MEGIDLLVIELKSTSTPSGFLTTTLEGRVLGIKVDELALRREVAVEGVGGGEVKLEEE